MEKETETVDLGIIYPTEDWVKLFNDRRDKLAKERNGGEVGRVWRVDSNGRGREGFYAPDIDAKWVEDFA